LTSSSIVAESFDPHAPGEAACSASWRLPLPSESDAVSFVFVASALESVGLAGEDRTNPYDLGYSRRKLLALASILAMQTPVVVLDEPTTGQDARGVERVASIVADLAAAGRTVIAISHDMRFVAESFDRVVVMREGRVILDGAPSSIFARDAWPDLRSTYLEPPAPAVIGDRLGLGATPTDGSLISALADQ